MDPAGGSNTSKKKDAESSPSNKALTLSTGKSKKTVKLMPSIEIAKKRVRAFSIQKKTPITSMVVPKTLSSSNTTPVIIGKLTGVKVTPKVEPDPEQKKLKPPKPGASRRSLQDSYTELQKRTLSEIEDMKRKMELVELGIPLGLICPTSTSEKAMPTKAMPPIKSFLDQSKVDELIREAKKAKQEGREYKFDYQKLLPDYDNPFQKRKDELVPLTTYEKERRLDRRRSESEREREKDRRRIEKYVIKRNDYKKDAKYKERDKERRYEEKQRDISDDKETDVNLNDYLVCDSWSLENDDKNSITSPKVPDKSTHSISTLPALILEQKIPLPPDPLPIFKRNEILKTSSIDSQKNDTIKIEKLQPVMDSFKYEIDPNDDEILDIFDKDSKLDRYAQQTKAKHRSYYDSPDKSMDYDQDNTKDTSMDGLNDDTFLESVINEIKQETLSDEGSHDKGLVEYEMSPNKEESPEVSKRSSVTPEIDDKILYQYQRSNYSEGYRSSDSYKSVDTIESGYKSVENFRLSIDKELDGAAEAKMSKSTVDSLETWSFVLKICQPLLFRHDKNKCYKETRTNPKLWFAENPKTCDCVKDRGVVYDELEMCKMALVDRVYGCDQIPDAPFPKSRDWYPRNSLCSTENTPLPLSNEWETEDSQLADGGDSTCTTPQRNDEMSLDREYQRFMEAVWPDVVESKKETSRSTTPVRHESRKKKKEDVEKDAEEKKPKKIKLSSEGWSQESDIEEEDKSKKNKMEKERAKSRKRKHSSSTLSSSVSENEEEVRKKRKLLKKKAMKKAKSKSAKRRRMGRKLLKKLKEKQKKREKEKETEEDDSDKKKEKKLKKKKQQKLKKKELKKKKLKAQSSSSSSSSSDTSDTSESDGNRKSKKAKKKALEEKKKVKKLRKRSSSESAQSFEEELFDVNILNNIKTERLTDDEIVGHKMMEFSPRRQKPREIINVKELQNDFVGNIHIKQEVIEHIPEPKELPKELPKEIPNELPKELPKEVQKEEVPKVAETEDNLLTKTAVAKVVDAPNVSPQPVKMPEDVPLAPALPALPVPPVPIPVLDESNMSQASSQESVCSVSLKDAPIFYEKDESHLRPSSQNSNYSFNDVINASQNNLYQKDIETITAEQSALYDKDMEIKVEQSLYPNKIESLSGDYSKSSAHQSVYSKVSVSPSDYSKVAASQGDYRKKTDSQSNYNKIPASQSDYSKISASQSGYNKRIEVTTSEISLYDKDIVSETECDDKYGESYEAGNYEMYEQMAMAYQSDVASQQRSSGTAVTEVQGEGESQRIETVVGARTHGEIKCDWRAGDAPTTPHRSQRPSRWGLKPGEVNIVLTGGGSQFPQQDAPEEAQPVYHIQSIANRTDTSSGYDEAYMDMYGAADRLQYGDCFSDEFDVHTNITPISLNIHAVSPNITTVSGNIQLISPNIIPVSANVPTASNKEGRPYSLDDRINKVLQETVLGGITNEIDGDKETSEKEKSVTTVPLRVVKRVSFADGYKPGQDSDVEEPPTKKRKRPRRTGSAWPCPASHPDHVPLWDALPPPPPPPGSPPPARRAAPAVHLLRAAHQRHASVLTMPAPMGKFDPSVPLAGFMPPEPPPGLITLQ